MSQAARPVASATAPATGAVAARRARILDAAARCFARSGFARTRVDDVAAEARVSRALVHHHFGSKEELARQVQEHMLFEWSAAADAAIAAAPCAGDALAAWLRINLADERREPLLRAIVADEAILASFEVAARRGMQEFHERLVRLLRAGIASGEFRSDLDVESTAQVLRAMQVGLMEHLMDETAAGERARESRLTAAAELLVAGLRRAR